MNFINPYKLLGVDPEKPSLKKLKKAYYNLALLCHPDKGGDKNSMDVVHKSYLYIKKQFKNCDNVKKYEELEEEFVDFCKKQETKPPPFRDIWEGTDEYKKLRNFNRYFDVTKQRESLERKKRIKRNQQSHKYKRKMYNNSKLKKFKERFDFPWSEEGYGNLMDQSEYYKKKEEHDNTITRVHENNITTTTRAQELFHQETKKVKNEFKNEIVIYKEPTANPVGYGDKQRFDVNKIEDFSGNTKRLSLCDYKKAFNIIGEENVKKFKIKKRTLKSLTEERDNFLSSMYEEIV